MHIYYSRRAFLANTLLTFPCLLTLTGCGGSATSLPDFTYSGIQGQATRSPLTPATQQGQTNEAPLPGVDITISSLNGFPPVHQVTDSQGNYKIIVAGAGTYQVQGAAPKGSQGFPRAPAAQTVTVPVAQFVTVNLSYDTGIR